MAANGDLDAVLRADLVANEFDSWTWRNRRSAASRDRIMRWQRSLRRIEAALAGESRPAYLPLLWRWHLAEAVKLGFTIPPGVFGPGLQIAHYGTITINTRARIGADCRIHPSTTVGATHEGVPRIGDRCYLGAGARVTGDVVLGDEVTVLPNAVVTHSFEQNNILLGGVPAKIVRTDVPFRRLH